MPTPNRACLSLAALWLAACRYDAMTLGPPEGVGDEDRGGSVGGVACNTGAADTCDGLDNDCDGAFDEDCACAPGAKQACGTDAGVCVAGAQTCGDTGWGECAGVVTAVQELCNGLDDNCDGTPDEGCSCADGTTQACGSNVGACAAGVQTCVAGAWGPCASEILAAGETCDNLDNDCDDLTDEGCDDDDDGHCDSAMTVTVARPAVCPQSDIGAGSDCDDDAATGVAQSPSLLETCNDFDDDCSGVADEGCDDDGDGFCDSAMVVAIGMPLVCPQSLSGQGNDCDDADGLVNPGAAAEICADGVDNDCDGAMDFQDAVACPFVAATIVQVSVPRLGGGSDVFVVQPGQPLRVRHGAAVTLQASISPAAGNSWSWGVLSARGHVGCSPNDIAMSAGATGAAQTSTGALLPNDAAHVGCIYTFEVTVNGYARGTAELEVMDNPPTVSFRDAVYDPTSERWRLRLPPWGAAGSAPTFIATASELTLAQPENDTPYAFTWSGSGLSLLACSPNCATAGGSLGAGQSARIAVASGAPPGVYELQVHVADSLQPSRQVSATLEVEVVSCIWVAAPGTGSGDGSGVDAANGMGSIQQALEAAAQGPGVSVCIAGSGVYTEPTGGAGVFTVPIGPDLLGGFDGSGTPSDTMVPVISLPSAAGATFASGYAGTIRSVVFRSTSAASTGNVTVDVADASPTFENVTIEVGGGASPIGLRIISDPGSFIASRPAMLGGAVTRLSGVVSSSTGVLVEGGDADLVLSGLSVIENARHTDCFGECRGIWVRNGASAQILGNAEISGLGASDSTAIAIDLDGASNTVIAGNGVIRNVEAGQAPFLDVGVVIRLAQTDAVTISNNREIGHWSMAGRAFGAAIADGTVARDGSITSGRSTRLLIEGNRTIGPVEFASWTAPTCSVTYTGEGPDVSVGIALVGTQGAIVRGNGRPKGAWAHSIIGGLTHINWSANTRRLRPITAGVWLVETSSVSIRSNEITSGGLRAYNNGPCATPTVVPPAVALMDGLPPHPGLGAPAEGASQNLVVNGNGILCLQAPDTGGLLTTCEAIELNAPVLETGPLLINNMVASSYGNYLVTLRQNGGAGTNAINNTFMAHLTPRPLNATPIYKWNILLDGVRPDGIHMVNNIIETRADAYDVATERLCILDAPSGTGSSIEKLRNNLLYVENPSSNTSYVRVAGSATTNYDANGINAILGADASENFVALPVTSRLPYDWEQSLVRLLLGSPAIDRGRDAGEVPETDIDGQARPRGAGVDVGADEY